jgi:hypothetical protein
LSTYIPLPNLLLRPLPRLRFRRESHGQCCSPGRLQPAHNSAHYNKSLKNKGPEAPGEYETNKQRRHVEEGLARKKKKAEKRAARENLKQKPINPPFGRRVVVDLRFDEKLTDKGSAHIPVAIYTHAA